MFKTLACLILMVACGKAPTDGTTGTSPQTGVDGSQTSVAATTVSTTTNISAKLYATEADLPPCDNATARELVYVKDTSQFFYCDTNWTPIDLKGPKGDAGAQGVAGVSGKDGVNGKDGASGSAGSAGSNGTNAQAIPSYVWVSPVDNSRWFLGAYQSEIQSGGNAYGDQTAPGYLCVAGSRLPTSSEYQIAIHTGLWNFFHSLYPSLFGFIIGVGPLKNTFTDSGKTYGNYNVIEGQPDGVINNSLDFSSLTAPNVSLPSLCRIN